MRSQHIAYRPDIDGLRALAITTVLLYHLWPDRVPGGFVGVDVFFVISGFLINCLLLQRLKLGNTRIRDFYFARINRLFPALLTVTGFTVLWGWAFLVPSDYQRLGKHLLSTFGFLENWQLHKESGYFDAEIRVKPLAHMWSLSIEEQFYLVFPLVLFLIHKRFHAPQRVLMLLFIASLVASSIGVYHAPSSAYLMPWMRAWELLAGGLLAYHPLRLIQINQRLAAGASWLGMALIIASAFWLDGSSRFPGLAALPSVLGATLIIAGGKDALLNRRFFSSPLMIGVGLVSYPLYLWHWVFIAFLYLYRGSEVTDTELALTGALSLLMASITYLGIERPLRSARKKTALTASLVMLALIVAGSGLSMTVLRGVPERFPLPPAGLLPSDARFPAEWRFGRCLLVGSQTPKDFKEECFRSDAPLAPSHQKIVLWGDSYAGHLYPGLKKRLAREGKDLIQLTAVGCPPLLGYRTPRYTHCSEVSSSVIDYLKLHPDVSVILAANWVGVLKGERYQMLEETLTALKATGVNDITLYGPPPLWKKPLPTLVLEALRRNPAAAIPDRFGPEQQVLSSFEMETWIRNYAHRYSIHFVSILDQLCRERLCLIKAEGHLTSMDHGHLTIQGSDAVFHELINVLESP